MAIFDNELIDNTSSPEPIQGPGPKEFLGSIDTMKVDTSMGGFENFASNTQPPGKTGLGIKELSNLNIRTDNSSFSSPFQMVTNKELSQNKRYDMYERDVNLENIQGLNQGWASQLANGVVKMGATAVGTFAQGFATIPNTVSSIKNGSITALSGDPDGYEGTIDNWLKNIEDYFPNYSIKLTGNINMDMITINSVLKNPQYFVEKHKANIVEVLDKVNLIKNIERLL